MELGRRVSAGMDRRRAPLFAAAYQAASTSQASSTIPVSSLPLRSLRSGEVSISASLQLVALVLAEDLVDPR